MAADDPSDAKDAQGWTGGSDLTVRARYQPERISLIDEGGLRLGALALDPPRRRVVHDDGREDILEPRVMQVLLALAKARGAILSREDLTACCWDGRVVGDDAINRVMSRLRRLAEGVGAGVFRLETITKVGFRLILERAEFAVGPPPPTDLVPVSPSITPPTPLGSVQPDPAASGPASSRWSAIRGFAAATLAILGLLLMVALLKPRAPAVTALPELQVAAIQNLSPGAAPGVEQALRQQLVADFGRSSAVRLLADEGGESPGPLAFRLSGSMQREGEFLRSVFTLTRGKPGTVIWSGVIDADPAVAVRQLAANESRATRCTLVAAVGGRGEIPDAALADYAQYCADQDWVGNGEKGSRSIENLRRAVSAAPDLAAAWSALGLLIADHLAYSDNGLWDQAGRAEATQAIARTLQLDPDNRRAHLAKALLLPWRDYLGREGELRLATQGEDEFGNEHVAYARFLTTVGRVREAAVEAGRAHSLDPLNMEALTRLQLALNILGDTGGADAFFDEERSVWPDNSRLMVQRQWAALWTGRYDAALGFLRSGRYDPAIRAMGTNTEPTFSLAPAAIAVFEALKSGDADQRARAAKPMAEFASDPKRLDPFEPMALAALGQDREGLRAAEHVVTGWGTSGAMGLFAPLFARARRLPEFAGVAQRLGLLDYWRRSGHPPDFCSETNPPPVCAMVKRR